MIENFYFHKIKRIVIIQVAFIITCVLFIAVCLISATFSKEFGQLAGIAGIVFLLTTAVLIINNYLTIKAEVTFLSEFVNATDGIGFINYSYKTGIISFSSNIREMTGIEADPDIKGEDYYHKIINQLTARPYSEEEKIYIQDSRDKWAKVFTYKDQKGERIIIQDVSVFVYSNNLARNLSYYDTKTSLLRSNIIAKQISRLVTCSDKTVCLCQIGFSLKDRKSGFSESSLIEKAVLSAAKCLKKYEAHNVIIGHKTSAQFWVLIEGSSKDFCYSIIKKIYNDILIMLENNSANLHCGCCYFDESIAGADMLIEHTDFAADDAVHNHITEPAFFSEESYIKYKEDYHKAEVFRKIIDDNLIDYHFQPIVNANTGAIFAYEALMRPREVNGIRLNPLEMLKIAENFDMLDAIEKLTAFNTLKFLSENQDKFADKKLFINSIPANLLSDKDYKLLLDSYGALFEKIVIEVTEGSDILESAIRLLYSRYTTNKAQIALDDYGTGYSNESNLLKIQPHYIKIDRSLISNINTDTQKQHLVKNMINFASQHGIKTLAEGVETLEELDTVIALGADYIQGYYTCKAMAAIMLEIPKSIKDEIVSINLKRKGYIMKSYEVSEENQVVDIVNIALHGYTEVRVKCARVKIVGEIENTIDMAIIFPQGTESVVTLENINIKGLNGPAIVLERNCNVTLNVEGSNNITYEGIRVPSTSSLFVSGTGDLSVSCVHNNGVCIGGNYHQSFGKISFDSTGSIFAFASGENVIGIGGGAGKKDSEIIINSGTIVVKVKGISIIGIGSISGELKTALSGANISVAADGQKVIAIGIRIGTIDLTSSANLKIDCSGDNCCAIGTIEKSEGLIQIDNGNLDITVNAKYTMGIATVDSNVNVIIKNGCISVTGGGDKVVCIGNASGNSDVVIFSGIIKAIARSSDAKTLSSDAGRIIIYGGNIITNDFEPITAYSQYGSKLQRYMLKDSSLFNEMVSDGENTYGYSAYQSGYSPNIYMYLPENLQSETFNTALLTSGKETRFVI